MTTISQQYDYSYQDINLGHHHGYLIKPLIKMINKTSPPPTKSRKNSYFRPWLW